MSVHFSSTSDEWATPQELFDELNAEFHFDLDVCAQPHNAKCHEFFSREQNGLIQQWHGTCWMNPPYGREIGSWVAKAYASSLSGTTVVCLVPARTDTRWWHEYASKADEIRLLRGRLKFGAASTGAPFPSALLVFRRTDTECAD